MDVIVFWICAYLVALHATSESPQFHSYQSAQYFHAYVFFAEPNFVPWTHHSPSTFTVQLTNVESCKNISYNVLFYGSPRDLIHLNFTVGIKSSVYKE